MGELTATVLLSPLITVWNPARSWNVSPGRATNPFHVCWTEPPSPMVPPLLSWSVPGSLFCCTSFASFTRPPSLCAGIAFAKAVASMSMVAPVAKERDREFTYQIWACATKRGKLSGGHPRTSSRV
eukprot:scaffold44907_cov64-Phaeocystis_antarctica.AAC.12